MATTPDMIAAALRQYNESVNPGKRGLVAAPTANDNATELSLKGQQYTAADHNAYNAYVAGSGNPVTMEQWVNMGRPTAEDFNYGGQQPVSLPVAQ